MAGQVADLCVSGPRDMAGGLSLFRSWLEEAVRAGVIEPTAMVLATATCRGTPSVRMVLLKVCDEHGFVFYTNHSSRKGEELAENPQATLCFNWPEIARRVSVEGRVEPVAPEEADAYFDSRPWQSRIGAWASRQSQPLRSRAQLLRRVAYFSIRLGLGALERPSFWSGFRVIPERIYFDFLEENISLTFPAVQGAG
ncbi:pyridoxamine 5'-phosphate oxidase [Sphingosinicella rhizophila]|uniref:Pyridoxamine 5'-phosphate oxidase n=1 Tax=Sphingosinicella rhizophila TaxID=3050082 RepID=A0ABU3QBU0_9SPHN|nr:pyridoxamine 5'-phosphate oxidase [Sphingosinicella sp. GR2756]MDT9600864.1 pyridoxamine 5'-phosphate oxidase [Sphingosinicella sp. GR2756]